VIGIVCKPVDNVAQILQFIRAGNRGPTTGFAIAKAASGV
jgi:hypothetical protein